MSDITPEILDSRYVPTPQKKYHCVPAAIQMIMRKNGLVAPSQDEIGFNLGVIIPPDAAEQFDPVRVGVEPDGCYGTHLEKPEFDFNAVANRLGWGLAMKHVPANEFESPADLAEYLSDAEEADDDVAICFDFLAMYENGKGGHVNLFDRVTPDGIRVIEPIQVAGHENNLWRIHDTGALLKAMEVHVDYLGGVWEFELTQNEVAPNIQGHGQPNSP